MTKWLRYLMLQAEAEAAINGTRIYLDTGQQDRDAESVTRRRAEDAEAAIYCDE